MENRRRPSTPEDLNQPYSTSALNSTSSNILSYSNHVSAVMNCVHCETIKHLRLHKKSSVKPFAPGLSTDTFITARTAAFYLYITEKIILNVIGISQLCFTLLNKISIYLYIQVIILENFLSRYIYELKIK